MGDVANIKGNQVELIIDNTSKFTVTLTARNFVSTKDVMATQFGTDVLATLVKGRVPELAFDINEGDDATREALLEYDAQGKPLAVGTQLPAHKIAIHDPGAANSDGDICFPKFVFKTFEFTMNGDGERVFRVTGIGQRDVANSKQPFEIGDPATVLGWGA